MVDKITISSIQPIPGSNLVFLNLKEEPKEEIIELEEPVIEEFTMDVESEKIDDSTEIIEQKPKRVMSSTIHETYFTNSVEEIEENSLVSGTDNIYMRQKKWILPIENLDNATYDVDSINNPKEG